MSTCRATSGRAETGEASAHTISFHRGMEGVRRRHRLGTKGFRVPCLPVVVVPRTGRGPARTSTGATGGSTLEPE